jgi:N-acyl-D-aspartate/D-glutamate deacylase
MQKAIDLIRQARIDGMDVTADIYPYIPNGLGLGSLIIHALRARRRGISENSRRQKDPPGAAPRNRNDSRLENWYRHVGSNWDNVLVAKVPPRGDKKFEGKSIAEIAKLRGKDEWDTFFDLVESGEVSVNPKV